MVESLKHRLSIKDIFRVDVTLSPMASRSSSDNGSKVEAPGESFVKEEQSPRPIDFTFTAPMIDAVRDGIKQFIYELPDPREAAFYTMRFGLLEGTGVVGEFIKKPEPGSTGVFKVTYDASLSEGEGKIVVDSSRAERIAEAVQTIADLVYFAGEGALKFIVCVELRDMASDGSPITAFQKAAHTSRLGHNVFVATALQKDRPVLAAALGFVVEIAGVVLNRPTHITAVKTDAEAIKYAQKFDDKQGE